MTTETRPEPPDSASIVGEDLEQSLVDAGVTAQAARAIRAAVELIVLRLRASVATRDDLLLLKGDLFGIRDDLRREMDVLRREMDVLRSEMESIRREMDGIRREMDLMRREMDNMRREMRWTAFFIITVLGGMLIALLARTF